MKNKQLLSFLFSLCCLLPLTAQFQLPIIDYDKIEMVKVKENRINKKVFLKKGVTVLEAHYPINRSIQSFCNRYNAAYDSIYIYYGKEMMEITFLARGGIYKTSWKEKGRILYSEHYFKNKMLQSKFAEYTRLDPNNPSPKCSASYASYKVGESFQYDENGELLEYKNYDTGAFKKKEHLPENNREMLQKFQEKADAIVIENYGKAFFKKHIRLNRYNSTAYHINSGSYHRNEGQPNISLNDGWFQEWEKEVGYLDYAYDIVFSEEERYAIIRVRLNRYGTLVEGVDKSTANDQAVTRGLLSQPAKKMASKKKVMKLAVKNGLDPKDPDLVVELKWIEDSEFSSKGTLQYQLLLNKLEKKIWRCDIYNFEKWLINPVTKEIDQSGESQTGECMVISYRVKKGGPNNKYGMMSEFETAPIISHSYDYLQRNMSYFLIAKKGDKYGLIDHEENVLLPFENDHIQWMKTEKRRYRNEYCSVRKNGVYGLYSKEGKMILPLEYASMKIVGNTIVAVKKEGNTVFDLRTKKVQ